ncbi:hypothetical protein CENSYa_0845 [Cenarchaeum symbiosum A]|uniref:Uncharacterized protein n=1 Tax=Cenarchaeum symbiosum (strain A) TaxID=414004 RepID=A0RVW1_CENSY|nr:hypothetical protein CENSYa_0845 [Cenarchaeum symbiosum A]
MFLNLHGQDAKFRRHSTYPAPPRARHLGGPCFRAAAVYTPPRGTGLRDPLVLTLVDLAQKK